MIYLQTQKIIDDYKTKKSKPLVLVTVTNHSRSIFPSDHAPPGFNNYTLEDVDYTTYMPYSEATGKHKRTPPFVPNKKPKLVSDTATNFWYFFDKGAKHLYNLFIHLESKLKSIKSFYEELYDESIKQTYDTSLILMMHATLKEAGIPHIILSPNQYQDRFISKENYIVNDWGEYCRKYPDSMGSGHCDERGHKEVANNIIKKIEETV